MNKTFSFGWEVFLPWVQLPLSSKLGLKVDQIYFTHMHVSSIYVYTKPTFVRPCKCASMASVVAQQGSWRLTFVRVEGERSIGHGHRMQPQCQQTFLHQGIDVGCANLLMEMDGRHRACKIMSMF